MLGKRLINTKVAGGGGCTDIVDNYDPFGGNGVALYQLNGNATDVSGNYNGTASNVTYGTGVFGQSASFNTSNSVLTAPRAFSTNSPYSVSGWAKIANGSTTQSVTLAWQIASTGTSQTQVTVSYDDVSTYKLIVNHKHQTNSTVSYDFAANDGQWHHYAVTFNGSSANLYIDGVNVASGALDPKGDVSSTNYIGGANFYNGTTYYNGLDGIDQVRYFNTALTPLEVEALYTEELCICDGTVDTLDILGDGSCIATYQLDGNANDLSGNYSGTPTDVSYGVGDFDLAGVFNGSSSKILASVPKSSSQSFSLWTKFGTQSNTTPHLLGYSSVGSNGFFGLQISSGTTLSILYWNGLTYARNTSTINIADNSWHHIVLTTSGNNFNIYIDGNTTPAYTTTLIGFTHATRSDFQISYENPDGANSYFNGSIDQVRIFNKALSAGEVTTLYNETACTKAACSGTTNTLDILGDGSCIAAYPLDGSPLDLSGNYNGVQTDVTYPRGYFDLAGSFNGSSSKVESQNFTTLNSFSISFWIKTTNTNIQSAFQFDDGSNVNANLFFIETNTFNIYPYNTSGGAGSLQANIPANFRDGNFHNFIYTTNGTTEKIYVDNVELSTTKLEGYTTTARTTNKFTLGVRRDGFGDFNGQIDQVRIFNKALSASEVTTLYNETPCN